MLIAGDEDMADGAVSFRYRDGSQKNGVPVDEAIAKIVEGRRGARAGLSRATRRPGPRGAGRRGPAVGELRPPVTVAAGPPRRPLAGDAICWHA